MLQRVKNEVRFIKNDLKFLTKPRSKELKLNPVFLIGCGRSGTTILGSTIGSHQSVTYLKERRDIWHKAYPEFNIWSGKTNSPKLIVRNSDDDERKTQRLKRLMFQEQVFNNGSVLLEKLPINNFRLDFINEAFPEAKFIYLHRNGIEVARSIEKIADAGGWYGKNSIKWNLINELAKDLKLSNTNYSNFEKGLLEWRYSIQFSESFFSKFEKDRYYSLSYQSFLEDPKSQIENIYKFLGLNYTEEFTTEITQGIKRRSKKMLKPDDRDIMFGGPLLMASIENRLRQTKPNYEYV